jgi:hypothetical protein
VRGMVPVFDLSRGWLNADGGERNAARRSFFPLTRLSQDFDICSRNLTDGVRRLRYLPNEEVEKGLAGLDTLAPSSRDHIW